MQFFASAIATLQTLVMPSALALACGAWSICWRATARTTPVQMLMVDKEADNKQHTKTTAPRYSEAWKHGRNVHSFMLLYT